MPINKKSRYFAMSGYGAVLLKLFVMYRDKKQCPETQKACNDETITRNNTPICQPITVINRQDMIAQHLSRAYNCELKIEKVGVEIPSKTIEKKRAQSTQSTVTLHTTRQQRIIEQLNDLCSNELNKSINEQEIKSIPK